MIFATSNVNAACADPRGFKFGAAQKMQFLQHPNAIGQGNNNTSIVGLWHVTYTSQGQLFFESLDQWHSDGTEFENANGAPAIGNVCFGVWKQLGPRTVQLSHIGWNFNPDGSSAGYFTLTETNTVSADGNTYQGTFDYKAYDVDGNFIEGYEVAGAQTAVRITVN